MNDAATFWGELIRLGWGAIRLEPTAFTRIAESAHGFWIALTILLLAGVSQAVGQSIVLFLNRVRPVRFFLSVAVSALLYVISYGFWVSSIWGVSNVVYEVDLPFRHVALGLALCYSPQLLGLLAVLPFFGNPISVLLSIWTFLAILAGLESVQGLTLGGAVGCAGLGWVVLQLLQRTVGRPLGRLTRWIRDQLAGTRLITDRAKLRDIVMAEQVLEERRPISEWVTNAREQLRHDGHRRLYLLLLAAAFLVFIGLSIANSGGILSGAIIAFRDTFGLLISLGIVALGALAFAIVLTPLEALSWWAGWREPEILSPGQIVRPSPQTGRPISRYVAFLVGIDQGSYEYAPNVEGFVDKLANSLPEDVVVLKGIVPYSVANRPLSQRRVLSFLWRTIENLRSTRRFSLLAGIINLRNLFAVLVSADSRYGPIQNQGLAQVLYNSLLHHGYEPGCATPLTLVGSSGGSQMAAGALPFLHRATNAPIEVVSIAGVISGNTGVMHADHLYHLLGEKDRVAPLGAILSPARWPVAVLSNWNRAWRRGKITVASLGPMSHNGPRGPYSHTATLPDGRTHLEHTIDRVSGIIQRNWDLAGFDPHAPHRLSNYELYLPTSKSRQACYDAATHPPRNPYRPLASWIGRLILPTAEERDGFVYLKIYRAPDPYQDLLGKTVRLTWKQEDSVRDYVKLTTCDVEFPPHFKIGQQKGVIYPERLHGWDQVDPLESIAGAHRLDDVFVRLPGEVDVEPQSKDESPTLRISADPVHLSGLDSAQVRIEGVLDAERFRVRPFNPDSRRFDGPEEILRLPPVAADQRGVFPSTNRGLKTSPLNENGWHVYGATNARDEFEVHSLAPRSWFEPVADRIIRGEEPCLDFINHHYWKNALSRKGTLDRTLLLPSSAPDASQSPAADPGADIWKEGDRALVLHTFGGIGGERKEFAPLGVFFGHFSFGIARVIRDSLTEELRFDMEYRQVYTHNPTGTISGSNDWTRYVGDRQYGWLGCRPIADILVKFAPLTEDYAFENTHFSPLNRLLRELDVMCARYRVGDGTGITYRNIVNSCVQDSAQALYAALRRMIAEFELNPLMLRWLREHPDHEQARRFHELSRLMNSLRKNLEPFGFVRSDWKSGQPTLGRFAEETPGKTLLHAATSWRSVLPRLANDIIAMILLRLGATLWVIRSYQVGGWDPEIEPLAPTDFGCLVPRVKERTELGGFS